MKKIKLNTWSIAAVDLETGMMGVALASCVPDMHADAVASLVPGKGVAVTQAYFTMKNRNTVYRMLKKGHSAAKIIQKISDPQYDKNHGKRQYGVITLGPDGVSIETYTGTKNTPWFGSQFDAKLAVTVQGNILVSEAVVSHAFEAFKGAGSFTDKLMAALAAGSEAGGDIRCNNSEVTQTAATAFILAAKAGDAPYATQKMGVTDMGTDKAPWLCLSVHDEQFGENSVKRLAKMYQEWGK